MPDKYIEKSFLLLIGLSFLIHLALFAGLYFFPQTPKEPPKEPVFIDLQQIPQLKQTSKQPPKETSRRAEQRIRVPKETAPRGDSTKDSQVQQKQTAAVAQKRPSPQTSKPVSPSSQTVSEQPPVSPGYSVSTLLKPKNHNTQQQAASSQTLFPKASRLAKLEDGYRRKFENDIAEGDTRFLNSDDIVFGSFLRRFEGAVYGVWRYPHEAAMRGIEGITPVKITFNKHGEITNIQLLESSGAKILDEEVFRALKSIGPIGGFPKGYRKDEFHLIAFFQYGGARRQLR